jgi:Domain of Unknown Function (DUF1080)
VKSTVALLAAISLPFFSAININFDSMKLGELPAGWTPVVTNQGAPPPNWIVKHDPTAPSRPNVLAQASKGGLRYRFPVCLFDKITCLDGDISVKMKILSGKEDQDAGVVFRAADQNNYYLVRASAREHNIVMFRVKDGHFEPIRNSSGNPASYGVRHPIKIGDWNLLRVTYKGNQATVYFNHRKVFDAKDNQLDTPGKAGVWTNADTVAYFDDFRIDKKR